MTACLPKTDKGGQMKIYLAGVGQYDVHSDIQVGSLVRLQKDRDFSGPDIPCIESLWNDLDHNPILGICIGLVIEDIPDESDVTVQWLQMCPHAIKSHYPTQDTHNRDRLVVIGQL